MARIKTLIGNIKGPKGDPGTIEGLDPTLSVSGAAPDSKVVGDRLRELENAPSEVDTTLTVEGAAADAKATGEAISALDADVKQSMQTLVNNTYGKIDTLTSLVDRHIPNIENNTKYIADTREHLGLSKNRLKYYSFVPGDEEVIDGVTFYWTDDIGIRVNGKATADINKDILVTPSLLLEPGTYWLTGCPKGGSRNTYNLYFQFKDNNTGVISGWSDVGDGVLTTISDSTRPLYSVKIHIAEGTEVNNLTFYPMISSEGGAYEPYRNGNKSKTATRRSATLGTDAYYNVERVEYEIRNGICFVSINNLSVKNVSESWRTIAIDLPLSSSSWYFEACNWTIAASPNIVLGIDPYGKLQVAFGGTGLNYNCTISYPIAYI